MPNTTNASSTDAAAMAGAHVLAGKADVAHARERTRLAKFHRLAALLGVIATFCAARLVLGLAVLPGWPPVHVSSDAMLKIAPLLVTVVLVGGMFLVMAKGGSKSPHQLYRSSEISTRLADVAGLDSVTREITTTLNLFLAHKTFHALTGGVSRRGVLFEGPPGTGKTWVAKAMAGEAGVPFLFVNASAFQTKFYGGTQGKIRKYFKELRKAARREGGAIGFIEEIDAIGGARTGMGSGTMSEGIPGVVNELLIQMQSFDEPTSAQKVHGWCIERINRWLPEGRQLAKQVAESPNVLIIAATNRAGDLDPALVRPGRFDRTISFDPPNRAGRADILSYYLTKKAHDPEVATPERIDTLAAMTMSYTPAELENLLNEALHVSLTQRGAVSMNWKDILAAKNVIELGLTSEGGYTPEETRTVAIHEAGHAVVAWKVGTNRKLEVLSILKRKQALGLLQHSDRQERFMQNRDDMLALMQICFGGMVAEEQFYFGNVTSGPSGDLMQATAIACGMIGAYGMGESLISVAGSTQRGMSIVDRVLSDSEMREKADDLLHAAKHRAAQIVHDFDFVVLALADALVARGELVDHEITDVIETALAAHAAHVGTAVPVLPGRAVPTTV